MHLYLGIDFGTTGVRTSVINEKKEELINYSVSIESPISKGSLVYQNPNLWWDALLKNFESTENECKSLLEKKLSLPAYDQCLKASHIFNLLDARGVIGVAERTGYITRIRELAKGCGALWLSSQS